MVLTYCGYELIIIYPHKLLLIHTQFPSICEAFGNGLSAKYFKNSAVWYGFKKFWAVSELKTDFQWRGNVLKPLVKGVLIPLGLTTTTAVEARIHKKILRYLMTTLTILIEEVDSHKNS